MSKLKKWNVLQENKTNKVPMSKPIGQFITLEVIRICSGITSGRVHNGEFIDKDYRS